MISTENVAGLSRLWTLDFGLWTPDHRLVHGGKPLHHVRRVETGFGSPAAGGAHRCAQARVLDELRQPLGKLAVTTGSVEQRNSVRNLGRSSGAADDERAAARHGFRDDQPERFGLDACVDDDIEGAQCGWNVVYPARKSNLSPRPRDAASARSSVAEYWLPLVW